MPLYPHFLCIERDHFYIAIARNAKIYIAITDTVANISNIPKIFTVLSPFPNERPTKKNTKPKNAKNIVIEFNALIKFESSKAYKKIKFKTADTIGTISTIVAIFFLSIPLLS